MKHVVVSSGLNEMDIRPFALMDEFKRLSILGAAEHFAKSDQLTTTHCPACGADAAEPVFSRFDFLYNRCTICRTVYVSPRPVDEALCRYYKCTQASRFRIRHFSRDTAKARRYHLLHSHANWMGQLFEETGNCEAKSYADLYSYTPEIFDEIFELGLFDVLYCIEPLLSTEAYTEAPVKTTALGEVSGLGAISAFEKIEHQFSPLALFERIRKQLAPGGLFFFTTRTITGFDLQILWDKTPYIFVPEHLNLLSIEGIEALVKRAGFELIELSTPGQLDLQLIKHAVDQDPSIRLPEFLRCLLDDRDCFAHEDFQAFLQKHRLSSHVRVAARKKITADDADS